jgi:excisionase family DNA binding protein
MSGIHNFQNTKVQNQFLTISEVAAYLSIKQKTIYAKVAAGEIPHYRIGRLVRFRLDEIDEWLMGCRNKNQQAPQKSGSRKRRSTEQSQDHFSKIITKTIDEETDKYYSVSHGKSGRIEGPKQEVEHGSI